MTTGKGLHGHTVTATPTPKSRPSQSTPTSATQSGATPAAAPGLMRLWSQTPIVEPSQTLAVMLTLRPLKSKQTQQYFFRVISQAVDSESLAPIIEQGNVQIKGLSIFRRLLPLVIILGMGVVMVLLIGLLLVTLGLFG